MRKTKLLFCGLLLTSLQCFSQGFLGYKQTLMIGIGVSPSGMLQEKYISYQDYNSDYPLTFVTTYDTSYFLPRINLNYGINLGSHVQFNLSLGWRPLRNSTMNFSSSYEQGNAVISQSDNFRVKSDVTEANGEFRFYSAFAPIGRYVTLGGGASVTGSDIVGTFNTYYNDHQVREVKPAAFIRKTFFSLSFGFGRTRIIQRKYVLDYGLKLNYYLGPNGLQKIFSFDYSLPSSYQNEKNFNAFLDYANLFNIQKHNTLEIYLRYGITW